MTEPEYTPRFIFEITEEQKARADRLLSQYGLRKAIFQPILDDVLDIIEEYGGRAVGILIFDSIKPREVIKTINRAEEGCKR